MIDVRIIGVVDPGGDFTEEVAAVAGGIPIMFSSDHKNIITASTAIEYVEALRFLGETGVVKGESQAILVIGGCITTSRIMTVSAAIPEALSDFCHVSVMFAQRGSHYDPERFRSVVGRDLVRAESAEDTAFRATIEGFLCSDSAQRVTTE